MARIKQEPQEPNGSGANSIKTHAAKSGDDSTPPSTSTGEGASGSTSSGGSAAAAAAAAANSKTFRRARSRASRACQVCHMRKVRCDVMIHQPCTNCVAFGCECKIPEKARKQHPAYADGGGSPLSDSEVGSSARAGKSGSSTNAHRDSVDSLEDYSREKVQGGSLIFLGSTSNAKDFLTDQQWGAGLYRRIERAVGVLEGTSHLSQEDITVLKIRGAFLMPPQELSDALVKTFFEYIHPSIPVINKNRFLVEYESPDMNPPILLRQAVFAAASRACDHPLIQEMFGGPDAATRVFQQRASALYEVEYENERLTSVQAALLISACIDTPEKLKNNAYTWTHSAITLAQSLGIHRRYVKSTGTVIERRMWTRLFWACFVRDRSTATAFGRPMMLNLEDTDVPMISAADFDETEEDIPFKYETKPMHVLFFIYQVKLEEILGLVLRQQYTVGAERLQMQNLLPDVSQCDMALASWVNGLPDELRYSIKETNKNREFLKAWLYVQYYTVLCLAHRPQVEHFVKDKQQPYPSWGIAFQAAHMIVRILSNLEEQDEFRYLPLLSIYTCFSALIMLMYQTESVHEQVVKTAQSALEQLMRMMKKLSAFYPTFEKVVVLSERIREHPQTRERFLKIFKKRKFEERRDDNPDKAAAVADPELADADEQERPKRRARRVKSEDVKTESPDRPHSSHSSGSSGDHRGHVSAHSSGSGSHLKIQVPGSVPQVPQVPQVPSQIPQVPSQVLNGHPGPNGQPSAGGGSLGGLGSNQNSPLNSHFPRPGGSGGPGGVAINGPAVGVRGLNGPQPINGPPINGPPINGPPINGPPINGPPMNGPPMNGQMLGMQNVMVGAPPQDMRGPFVRMMGKDQMDAPLLNSGMLPTPFHNSADLNELCLVTQTTQGGNPPAPANGFQPGHLFPENNPAMINSDGQDLMEPFMQASNGYTDLFHNDDSTVISSGDEQVAFPETLNMVDWYEFLMDNTQLGGL